MKKVFAPNGNYIIVPDDRVMTFGLTKMQNESVGKVLPIKDVKLYVIDVPERFDCNFSFCSDYQC